MAFFLDELVHEKSGIVEILLLEAFTVGVEVSHADADQDGGEALRCEPVRIAAAAALCDGHGLSHGGSRLLEELQRGVALLDEEGIIRFLCIDGKRAFGEFLCCRFEGMDHRIDECFELLRIAASGLCAYDAGVRDDVRRSAAGDGADVAGGLLIDASCRAACDRLCGHGDRIRSFSGAMPACAATPFRVKESWYWDGPAL